MKRVRSAMQVGEQSEKRTRIEPKRQLKSTTTVANVMRRNSEVKTPPIHRIGAWSRARWRGYAARNLSTVCASTVAANNTAAIANRSMRYI